MSDKKELEGREWKASVLEDAGTGFEKQESLLLYVILHQCKRLEFILVDVLIRALGVISYLSGN